MKFFYQKGHFKRKKVISREKPIFFKSEETNEPHYLSFSFRIIKLMKYVGFIEYPIKQMPYFWVSK